jgi:hypothetical protein
LVCDLEIRYTGWRSPILMTTLCFFSPSGRDKATPDELTLHQPERNNTAKSPWMRGPEGRPSKREPSPEGLGINPKMI